MTRKFKFFLFFIIFLFILFVLGAIRVEKKMLFLNERTQQHESIINELNSKNIIDIQVTQIALTKRVEYLTTVLELPSSESNDIKSKSNIYNIRTFQLPFLSRTEWKGKAVAYLEQTDNEIIIASGDGEFFTFKKKDIESDSLYLKKIRTNVKNLIKDQKFYLSGAYGIRDLFILDNKILFSYIKKIYNTILILI